MVDHKTMTVADTITCNWIAHHGVPLRLHCDNAPEFKGYVLKEVKELLGVKGTFTTLVNRLCESTNQTIEGILRTLIRDNRKQRDNDLALL